MELAIIEDAPRECTIVELAGELDIANAPDLREQLLLLLDRRAPSRLVFDLSKLEFMDSSGVAALVSTERRAGLLGCTFALVAPQPRVARVLQICGLDQHFRIFKNVQAAAGMAQPNLGIGSGRHAER